jgi:SAM-dependent methyltransferase
LVAGEKADLKAHPDELELMHDHPPRVRRQMQGGNRQELTANWYDFPAYYDLAVRRETRAEADFIEAACRKYVPFQVRRLLEPGCGSGRLVVALAQRSYELTACDVNEHALAYLRRKLDRRGLTAKVFRGDMADFSTRGRVESAFCTFNTFRHLLTEGEARRHLECVARAVRPGGIYILGFHLLPLDVAEESEERWRAKHGSTRLHATLRVVYTDRRQRLERLQMNLLVRSPRRSQRIVSEFPLRMYTAAQFRRLLHQVRTWELCDVYDFWYDIYHPRGLDDVITDAVFVLRNRGAG